MDEMSSVEFRKRYAKLTQPTIVTVLGRPIGTWTPVALTNPNRPIVGVDMSAPVVDMVNGRLVERRPFTPVPKPGRKMG